MKYFYILAGLLILIFIWSLLERKIIVKTVYKLKSDRKGIVSGKFTFVVLSDLHNVRFGADNKPLLQKIFKLNPDFVIIAGDLITKRKPCYPGNAFNLIKELSDHYPVYYAYGNHEQYFENMEKDMITEENRDLVESWTEFKTRLNELGVYMLDNKSITIKHRDNTINIMGLSIDQVYYERGTPPKMAENYIESEIGKSGKDEYQILIAHNPVYFEDYVRWGADLTLSGHVHGGLIRIPFIGGVVSPQVRLFPKYDAGLYEKSGRYMIVSRGLGTHSFMPRLLNPPELVVVDISAE